MRKIHCSNVLQHPDVQRRLQRRGMQTSTNEIRVDLFPALFPTQLSLNALLLGSSRGKLRVVASFTHEVIGSLRSGFLWW